MGDLGDERFAVRRAATDELEKAENLAEMTLRQALTGKPSLELRRRVELLLRRLDGRPPAGDTLRQLRCVELLERLGGAEARAVLEALAGGSALAPGTAEAREALDRLTRRAP